MSEITKDQFDFYSKNRSLLIDEYLDEFPFRVDPDAVRDLFAPIGYDRSNVKEYDGICKLLTEDIYYEALNRNIANGNIIFAAGLPGSGKSTHIAKMAENQLVYDGTLNDDEKFIKFIGKALALGYKVQVFIYFVDPPIAFTRNLVRGDQMGRYVPISHYEKVAATLNRRADILQQAFENKVKLLCFEHTNFEGRLIDFKTININRDELERIARNHKYKDSEIIHLLIG